ncbi:YoaK family protein [Paenibacillus sp. KACC 21273]|uniref:YoaK family protein n=1 Tax=Paenibacillus sp. KACC 21273 TaxID=3025665 RepID=UPI002366997E|nr:YoaK family protein [Paenibacillus sp. KACC 21273]WDF50519.1 YoaK family protein [Paenibacillus sp. KACC 21273]
MSKHHLRYVLLLCLCFTAGLVDVIGYLRLEHVFTANMTGNIVVLGMSLGRLHDLAIARVLTALVGFVIGNMIAAIIIGSDKSPSLWYYRVTTALIVEWGLLCTFALLAYLPLTETLVFVCLGSLSMAMGIQTTAARRLGIAGISTTVLTNNLVNAVEDMVAHVRQLLSGHPQSTSRLLSTESRLRILGIVLYACGAIVATVLERHTPLLLSWIPVSLVTIVIVIALWKYSKSDTTPSTQKV